MSDCIPAASSKCCFPSRELAIFLLQFFYPNSTELPEASAQTYYDVLFFTIPVCNLLPPLLLPQWAMHTLTGIPRCLSPCPRDLHNTECADHLICGDNLSEQALPKAP